jgi:membrane protein CcdC involved in cytochrome C biogenesis
MSAGIRRFHRWVSTIFMVTVVINIVAALLKAQALWIGLMALFPLVLLMVTGLYMFVRPYFSKEQPA